jgi:hypothetical protein
VRPLRRGLRSADGRSSFLLLLMLLMLFLLH